MWGVPTFMKTTITSLRTANPASGLALSLELAREVSASVRAKQDTLAKPGGENYGEPPPMPMELIAGVLMVAVSIANEGWAKKEGAAG